MDSTALYYTFSTIAQALAGAFGVLAAFAVLAWGRLEAEIADAQRAVLTLKAPFETAWETFRKYGYEEFLKRELPTSSVNNEYRHRLRRGAAALQAQRDLRRRLIIAAAPTVAAVAISVVALPLVPVLCRSGWSIVVTIAAVGFTLASFVVYGRAVVGAIRAS